MSDQAVNMGYCGKVPSRGDFIAHQLERSFQVPWNEWLQSVVAVSKEQLGDMWTERYLTSPVWHFALSSGACGANAMCGSFIPSVDAVGRHFPFTVAAITNSKPLDCYNNDFATQEYEDAVLNVLEDSVDLPSWFKSVNEQYQQPKADIEELLLTRSGDPSKESLSVMLAPSADANTLLHNLLSSRYANYCLWWTHGSCLVEPCLLVTPGLPAISQFSAMLDGRWQHWDWNHSQKLDRETA
ncbi:MULTISPECIES: type VI secretion system-associated protein TagF [Pseudoalteromonas]|uniref:Type VI secretion system-associated protein TagF n=1 Tax=Pseudoalteromonas ruthenica TaxID=151081 RepID=A0A0F4PYX5_9GAMM|nr:MULTISPECIES: type VI secretion system-associated protein TagF [Pseudoalteromonas]KJY94494.1 hypothetical protein TW76_18190 [Pseudoalteromonas ruthenica]KJZ00603.1 hypothetical protein TW72_08000 [Pseudoalteromonas ruthenica]MCG7565765.1 type VI secretion system-associated protein TagF [Pseudoalteromonas sp. CnMc7-15]MCG7569386.1 type VI secretion system-associated protein TagF [Pseudoalteromonas sp. CNC9-20]QFU06579.1 hypothetical protein FIU82_16440 [Pseudoalteromonas sp. THAF3]